MTARTSTYPLRFPVSVKSEAEKLAASGRGRADWEAFDRLMYRQAGEPPRPGDELPEGA